MTGSLGARLVAGCAEQGEWGARAELSRVPREQEAEPSGVQGRGAGSGGQRAGDRGLSSTDGAAERTDQFRQGLKGNKQNISFFLECRCNGQVLRSGRGLVAELGI